MKKLMTVLFLTVILAVGCGTPQLPTPDSRTVVKVDRSVGFFREGNDPGIKIGCEAAILDYNGRKVIIEGAKHFGSWGGMNWIGKIRIDGDKLVLELPQDAEYRIFIGKQKHSLPQIKQGVE